jgi:hypothetical protein
MIKQLVRTFCALAVCTALSPVRAQAVNEERLRALEQQLAAALRNIDELHDTVNGIAAEIETIRSVDAGPATVAPPIGDAEQSPGPATLSDAAEATDSYADRILVTDLGHDERAQELSPRPELFIQSRYHANPIDEASDEDVTRNLGLNRVEVRWAGRLSDRIGMGYEIQYHPAPDGASEELVNDAYVEYYSSDSITIRAGQFVKPFGFDIQHSSSDRESPERGIFAGYFFPGQRDRGLMLTADLNGRSEWLDGTTIYAGIFNGNRFFNDNNSSVNYNLRARKIFDRLPLAIGASVQRGTQILPDGVTGNDDENLYGIDLQYVIGRLGIRAEYMRGNMPSTLLGLEPEFATGFEPGQKSSGAAAFFNYELSSNDDIYWRWDKFENDPVTRRDIRAFNVGYLRAIGPNSRIGIDYQHKNDVTFNDDELNNALSITWNVTY